MFLKFRGKILTKKTQEKSVEVLQSENALMQTRFPKEFRKLQVTGRFYLWLWLAFVVSIFFCFAHPVIGILLASLSLTGLVIFGRFNKRLRRDLVANLAVGSSQNEQFEGKPCSACAEIIKNEAVLCRYCGTQQSSRAGNQDLNPPTEMSNQSKAQIKRTY